MNKDLLTLAALSAGDILRILDTAAGLKDRLKRGELYQPLIGRTLAMIFEKSSTRTRVSFEAGMTQLGGHAMFLSRSDTQIGRGEEVRDTARVLSRYADAIMIRTFSHELVEELARYADIPVINGLTDLHHPCQVLADLLTVREHKGKLAGLKLAYIGDGNNMANSLIEGCVKAGMSFAIACPAGYGPDEKIMNAAREYADKAGEGAKVEVVRDPFEAVKGADAVYTDVWASMGQESEKAIREKAFKGYQVSAELVRAAAPGAIVMHCLPAHRGEEITDEVMEGKNSVVFDQAENRLHAQKAVLELLINS
jgi:ornithine carbamoyltransferase